MPLARALVPAFLVLAMLLGPARAGSDSPSILTHSEEIQARGIRVLAALLVALTASGPQGVAAPPGRIAEAERQLADKLFEERNSHAPPVSALRLRRIAGVEIIPGHRNAVPNAKDYNAFHTISEPSAIIRPPITPGFEAPCDRRARIGWPHAEATEMLRADCTGLVPRDERSKLPDRLYRRRLGPIPDAILGQNAPPSPFRMNLDGISRTHLPALFFRHLVTGLANLFSGSHGSPGRRGQGKRAAGVSRFRVDLCRRVSVVRRHAWHGWCSARSSRSRSSLPALTPRLWSPSGG